MSGFLALSVNWNRVQVLGKTAFSVATLEHSQGEGRTDEVLLCVCVYV